MRALVLLVLLLLLAPSAARAQTVTPTPSATPAPTAADEDATDPVDDEAPVGDGDDSEEPCDQPGTDGDYDYCNYSARAGEPVTAPEPKEDGGPVKATTGTITPRSSQALPATTLPYTGASPLPVALLGLALLLMGTGGRLMTGSSRSAVRSRDSVT